LKYFHRKLDFFLAAVIGLFVLVLIRLFWIQVLDHDYWYTRAKKQHIVKRKILRKRGTIYDRNGNVLAYTAAVKHLICDPSKVKDPDSTLGLLASYTRLNLRNLKEKLLKSREKGRRYLLLKDDVTMEEYRRIRERMEAERDLFDKPDDVGVLSGCVYFKDATRRYYPYNMIAANVLGFVGKDGKGLEGAELSYNDLLSASHGLKIYERGLNGLVLPNSEKILTSPDGGTSVYLSLDVVIQYLLEKKLREAYESHRPKSAVVVVLNPKNGEILGMASQPSFNPNYFPFYSASDYRNRAIADQFEPGSTMKAITVAAAIESNAINTEDLFECKGYIELFDVFRIHCDARKVHGEIFPQAIMKKSCNVGAIYIAQRLGSRKMFDFLERFGFGQKTGIQLPGEVSGINREPRKWSGLSLAAKSIGQEIAVNSLQMGRAFASIVNGGVLYHPKILVKTQSSEGKTTLIRDLPVRRVISSKTSEVMRKILKTVTETGGSGRRADISGYDVLGKTGTAQSLAEMHKSTSEWDDGLNPKVVASFVGAIPAEDPQLVMYVMLNEPQGEKYYGGQVAAPIFRELGKEILAYMKIRPTKPDETEEDDGPLNAEQVRQASVESGVPAWMQPARPAIDVDNVQTPAPSERDDDQIPDWLRLGPEVEEEEEDSRRWLGPISSPSSRFGTQTARPDELLELFTKDDEVLWD